jgi:hypothetical protein
MKRICILFISESLRKEGDVGDPYIILQNMVDAGTFDSIFSEFGMRMARLRNPQMRTAPTQ